MICWNSRWGLSLLHLRRSDQHLYTFAYTCIHILCWQWWHSDRTGKITIIWTDSSLTTHPRIIGAVWCYRPLSVLRSQLRVSAVGMNGNLESHSLLYCSLVYFEWMCEWFCILWITFISVCVGEAGDFRVAPGGIKRRWSSETNNAILLSFWDGWSLSTP